MEDHFKKKFQLYKFNSYQEEVDNCFDCTKGIMFNHPKCKIYSKHFINRFLCLFDISKCYKDYAPKYINHPEFEMSSFLLEPGIRKLDLWFCKEIRKLSNGKSKFTKDQMLEFILTCSHLHPMIRNNLYYNTNILCK